MQSVGTKPHDERRRARDEKQRAENRKYGAPINVATSWDQEEDEQLRAEFKAGMDPADIARAHGRLEMGVRERLVSCTSLNLI